MPAVQERRPKARARQGWLGTPAGTAPAWPRLRAFGQRRSVLLACMATLVVHLLWLTGPLGDDEGGFAMVARYWREDGPFLYGPLWVDRPPGLIALFDAAQRLGPYGVRLTATLLAIVMVAALASAAKTVGGPRAARWAAWAGFALASSVLLRAERLNGELAAAVFVTLSVAAFLRAVHAPTVRVPPALLALLAGASATMAVLMKQNFVDGYVFAAVFLAVGVTTPATRLTYQPRHPLMLLAAFTGGAAVPWAVTLAWASGHGGVGTMAYAMYGFRADATAVMASSSWEAPLGRLGLLAVLGGLSGVLLMLAHLGWSNRQRLRHPNPLHWAVAATAGVEALGVLAGLNYWSHYLIGFIPMVGLAAGLSVHPRMRGSQWTRRLVVLAAATTAVVSPAAALVAQDRSTEEYAVGRWVAASAEPGDTLVVPFSHPNVIDAARLGPGYPYAWSLPVRTLDPDLTLFRSTLTGPAAPTWVVRWNHPRAWGLDPGNRVQAALEAGYRRAANVCGHTVWLREDVDRPLAPTPPVSACGTADPTFP